jgi:choline dehydrogenase
LATVEKQNGTAVAQKTYMKEKAYSHHASSSVRIGAEDDWLSASDSQLRVRKVAGLRGGDVSSFHKVSGGKYISNERYKDDWKLMKDREGFRCSRP